MKGTGAFSTDWGGWNKFQGVLRDFKNKIAYKKDESPNPLTLLFTEKDIENLLKFVSFRTQYENIIQDNVNSSIHEYCVTIKEDTLELIKNLADKSYPLVENDYLAHDIKFLDKLAIEAFKLYEQLTTNPQNHEDIRLEQFSLHKLSSLMLTQKTQHTPKLFNEKNRDLVSELENIFKQECSGGLPKFIAYLYSVIQSHQSYQHVVNKPEYRAQNKI